MLSNFPHLNQSEFEDACHDLQQRFERHKQAQKAWQTIERNESYGTRYLRITKVLPPTTISAKSEESDMEDNDDEVVSTVSRTQPLVHYDIVLSPTYRVPILYISIKDALYRFPPTMETLYKHIIAPQYASQTRDYGVLGGITVTDHPISNTPVFSIHPCRTAEVMQAAAGSRQVSAAEYLTMWIGALGKCVGLDIPIALAMVEQE